MHRRAGTRKSADGISRAFPRSFGLIGLVDLDNIGRFPCACAVRGLRSRVRRDGGRTASNAIGSSLMAIGRTDDSTSLRATTIENKFMSIKSDKWIRRMAASHKMIEPFEPGQVREANGHKIVSYGTSSYGYDIRCSNEFKIFTNINSTIVDPKHFDAGSFVDFKGDVCIIPPNSFALARTVEYFRIPRNVLTICLGKCVTGDTRVVDADTGAYRPISQMAAGSRTLALSGWRNTASRVAEVLPQGKKPVYELRTRLGKRIRATANHPFRQFDGWTALENLKPGDRIAVARSVPVFGKHPLPDWEASLLGLMISEGQCRTPGHSPTFTSCDPALVALLERCVADGSLGAVTRRPHYGYRLVNHAKRGGIPDTNRASLWLRGYGLDVTAEGKFVPESIFTAPRPSVRLFLQALFSGDGSTYRTGESYFVEYYSKSRRLIEDVHHLLLRFGIFSLIRDRVTAIGTPAHKIQITDRDQIVRFAREVGFCPGSMKQVRLEDEVLPPLLNTGPRRKSNFDTLPKQAWSLMALAATSAGMSFNRLSIATTPTQSVGLAALQTLARATGHAELSDLVDGPVWDVVESIEYSGIEEVFDLCVPDAHNFFANDVAVHNSTYARCGVIVNVTPFEPEWEGFVTLEFSNTTPLPAKIYANEGVAQVIFFESDEVCETSYKDRGGKYQGQQGVTLPKI
jgi:deoxycytidine triphosphate deaminase